MTIQATSRRKPHRCHRRIIAARREEARVGRRFGLRPDGGVPIDRLRQTLFQIPRRRGGVGGIVTWNDESRNGDAHQRFGRCARRGVAIKQSVAHPLAGRNVLARIITCISGGEIGVALNHRCPRPAARIGAERLALRADERDHLR